MQHPSGRRIRQAREAMAGRQGRHLSRETLAYRVGVVSSTIQKWERRGLLYADEYGALARELGCSLEWLLLGEGEPPAALRDAPEGGPDAPG